MAIIKLSAGEKRRFKVFFTCVVFAFLAWLFFSLSKEYDYDVKTVANFKNLPQNKAFYPLQSDTIMLTVKGTGWQLLFNRLSQSVPEIKIDLSPLERRNFVSIQTQIKDINRQFSTSQHIIMAKPDTLFFDFTARKVKRVPVRLKSELIYKQQFGKSDKITLKPSHVTLTGPAELLQNIEYWDTDTFRMKNISKTVYSRITLKKSSEVNISIFPNVVEVHIPVDEFTEKELEIPIKVVNNTRFDNVKLIPQTVKVNTMVSLEAYSSVSSDNISAYVDLSLWKNMNVVKLPVALQNENPFVKIMNITPHQVDFIITKQ